MAAQAPPSEEDPLTAALPPVTDYITYLTILEYRLNAGNLGTLNGILDRDDGTLAKEIGWDLLRLVLPMLPDAPRDAAQCLDTIARRGNPREVVVRVAEELEKLGRLDDDADDNDDESDGDGLPTFDGEAERRYARAPTATDRPGQDSRATIHKREVCSTRSCRVSSTAQYAEHSPSTHQDAVS
jgi:hypothetical protein